MIDLLTDMALLTLWLILLAAPFILGALAVVIVFAMIEKIFGN